ncbi:MAG TPA: hypothetical protein VFB21_01540 [Chthonomonadaceae bacterium]|nr:hypothetical protein [Chthonomonadaceae bacterium]
MSADSVCGVVCGDTRWIQGMTALVASGLIGECAKALSLVGHSNTSPIRKKVYRLCGIWWDEATRWTVGVRGPPRVRSEARIPYYRHVSIA